MMARVVVAVAMLTACGSTALGETTADTVTPAVSTTPQTTTTEALAVTVEAPAEAPTLAVRVDPPTTMAPPFDPVAYVNALPYGWTIYPPAMDAFRVVALSRGWSEQTVAAWSPFVFDVISKESNGCWNAKGGDIFEVGSCRQYVVRGHREDSGFGQVTSSLYGQRGVLCTNHGMCSQAAVIATPWSSMVAVVATLEELGRFPWCWDARARNVHNCTLVSADARP